MSNHAVEVSSKGGRDVEREGWRGFPHSRTSLAISNRSFGGCPHSRINLRHFSRPSCTPRARSQVGETPTGHRMGEITFNLRLGAEQLLVNTSPIPAPLLFEPPFPPFGQRLAEGAALLTSERSLVLVK